MSRPRTKSKRANITLSGDHGPQTAAQLAGATIQPIKGDNPNNVAQKRRESVLDRMHLQDGSLSLRQYLAGDEIQAAYCQVEKLSSGGELKEQVDSSPNPGKIIAIQADAQSRLNFVMKAVPKQMRPIVQHVCWDNSPVSTYPKGDRGMHRANLKVALDLVATKLGY